MIDLIDCGRHPSRRLGRAGGCSRDASHHLPRRRARIVAVHRSSSSRVRSRRCSRVRGDARRETAAPWVVNSRERRVGCHREFRLGGGSVGRPRVLETRVGAKKHENIRLDRSTRVRSTRAARKVRDGVGQRRPREGRHDPREATTGR